MVSTISQSNYIKNVSRNPTLIDRKVRYRVIISSLIYFNDKNNINVSIIFFRIFPLISCEVQDHIIN